MKDCDKRNSNISIKLHIIYIHIYSNNGTHPVTKTFTPLHYTSPNYTPLHYTSRYFSSFLTFRNNVMPSSTSVVFVSVKNLSYLVCCSVCRVDRSVCHADIQRIPNSFRCNKYVQVNAATRWIILCTGLFISPSGISELDCATTKTDTAERSISIG